MPAARDAQGPAAWGFEALSIGFRGLGLQQLGGPEAGSLDMLKILLSNRTLEDTAAVLEVALKARHWG